MTKIIAADIGNTETTLGIRQESNWKSYRFTTRDSYTPDELLSLFNSTFQLNNDEISNFHGSIICSVVPQLTNNIKQALNSFVKKEPLVVGPGIKTGLKVNIDNPKELGPDRIANAVAGFELFKTDVVIVDLGTATTFDVVTKDKEYLGGAIAPGIKISLDALTSRTASLKSVELNLPTKVIGKNTYEAIQSGLLLGHASMIENMLERIILEQGFTPKVILTGGLSRIVSDAVRFNVEVVESLTLDGLETIYNINN